VGGPSPDGYGRIRTQRLFVAVALPPDVCTAVADLVDRVRAVVGDDRHPVRWVRLDGLHLTLRFLGPTTPERLAAVAAAVRTTAGAHGPIAVALDGAGGFPTTSQPRVLWLGVGTGAAALGAVAVDLETRMVEAGWPAEGRPFRPHLSLARADGVRSGPRTAAVLAELAAGLDVTWTADRLTLFESHVGGGPARYEPLLEVPFGG
jgi:2'-5' RNA ligase